VRREAVKASSDDAATEVLIEEAIDGSARRLRDALCDVVGDEGRPGAVLEERRVQHDGVRRQARELGEHVLQRTCRQVGERDTAVVGAEFASRLIEQPPIERGFAGHDDDASRVRMDAERDLEGRRELTLDQNAADVRRQRPVAELPSVDPAEDDRRAGKDLRAMLEQEVERGSKDRNRHVELPVRIFRSKKIPQGRSIVVGVEAGEIHFFPIDLDTVLGIGDKRADEVGAESREAGQIDPLVVQQQDVPCRGPHRQGARDPDDDGTQDQERDAGSHDVLADGSFEGN
jgi:hypothetical protein